MYSARPKRINRPVRYVVAIRCQSPAVRVVVDTNVVISALLKPGSVPDRLLEELEARGIAAVFDERTWAEVEEVAHRRKFRAVPRARVRAILSRLASTSERVADVPAYARPMRDEDDRKVLEVALATGAVLVTGNGKDFPPEAGAAVRTPAEVLTALTGGR
jgi:putative PIN family toxin of toxin-antitoxin system